MRFHHAALSSFVLLAAFTAAVAGEFNPVMDIGKTAPAWKNLPGVDGKQHSLADLDEKKVVVVVFTCNSCPYAVDYEDRIVAFAKEHAAADSPVALVAINVNTVEEDLLPAMKERAEAKGFTFPYLFDESQQIARDYGAGYTPEIFVLDSARKIVYMGSLDDAPDPTKVKEHYVADAVKAALAGKPAPTPETFAIGCTIRFERRRRRAE